MNFEQFQATCAAVSDLGAVIEGQSLDGFPGNVYLGQFYIAEVNKPDGAWLLEIERSSFLSDDLEDLERQLYRFAVEAGAITTGLGEE